MTIQAANIAAPQSKTYIGLAGEGGGSSAVLVGYDDDVKRVTKLMFAEYLLVSFAAGFLVLKT